MKKLNTRRRSLREGKVNLDSDQCLDSDAFDVGTIDNKVTSRKYLEREKRIMISSFLISKTRFQQSLALHSALTSRALIGHAIDCGFYWKENRGVEQLMIQTRNQLDVVEKAVKIKKKKRSKIR